MDSNQAYCGKHAVYGSQVTLLRTVLYVIYIAKKLGRRKAVKSVRKGHEAWESQESHRQRPVSAEVGREARPGCPVLSQPGREVTQAVSASGVPAFRCHCPDDCIKPLSYPDVKRCLVPLVSLLLALCRRVTAWVTLGFQRGLPADREHARARHIEVSLQGTWAAWHSSPTR